MHDNTSTGLDYANGRIVGLFIPVDSEAGTLAVHGLPIFSFCAIFFPLNIAYTGYYQSMGKASRAVIHTLLRGVILLVSWHGINQGGRNQLISASLVPPRGIEPLSKV